LGTNVLCALKHQEGRGTTYSVVQIDAFLDSFFKSHNYTYSTNKILPFFYDFAEIFEITVIRKGNTDGR
jgi:hypothetical protein